MPIITRDLLRKRAEHNEGLISTLEEVTLHQEELEGINEVLGMTCKKLKILYLQNNIINKIENLNHLKELEYVNLALNNISKIEGLQNCEFLKKLDLTVNFIDVDELESSINHLIQRDRLRDFYMMGNPAEANWSSFKQYVIAKLPQLTGLDGIEITRSMQIIAVQQLPAMERELRELALDKRREKKEKARLKADGKKPKKKKSESRVVELDENDNEIIVEDVSDDEEDLATPVDGMDDDGMTENTPEVRQEIYRELAQQKKEKQDREDEMKPRKRDFDAEHKAALEGIRKKEEESGERDVKQKNEGNWDFKWDEDSKPGILILNVPVPKHLDSSLIDVDVHPSYVSIIIKSKTLRLKTLCEIRASESKCQRAKVNGALMVLMPKLNAKENVLTFSTSKDAPLNKGGKINPLGGNARTKKKAEPTVKPKKLTMQEQMMADALAAAGGTTLAGAVNGVNKSLLSSGAIGGSSASKKGVDVSNIVRKRYVEKNAESNIALEEPEARTVFEKTSLVEELD